MDTKYYKCNMAFYQRACELFGDKCQKQLVDMTKLSQGKISDILSFRDFPDRCQSKRPSAETVYKIATAFNVTTDYLLGLTDVQSTNKATVEMCQTLGLSETAIKLLSCDPDNVVGKHYRENVLNGESSSAEAIEHPIGMLTQEQFESILNGCAKDMRDVFNRMVEDFVEAFASSDRKSLIVLLNDFFTCIDTASFVLNENGKDCVYSNPMIFGKSQKGKYTIASATMRVLMLNSLIIEITAKLKRIQENAAKGGELNET